MQGRLIAVEGLSCSGKSTIINILKDKLKYKEENFLFCGGFDIDQSSSVLTILCNELAQQTTFLRINYIAEFHLLIAEMLNEIFEKVIPALNDGKIVLYNNYIDSIIAFEKGIYSDEKEFKKYIAKTIKSLIKQYKIPRPDYTVFVNCSIQTTIKRLKQRDGYKDENANLIQSNIYKEYLKILPQNTIFINNETTKENLNLNIEELLNFLREEKII